MKKSFLLVILMIMMVCILSAQTNPSLAILPFTGGNNNEGDTISILFSGERVLREAFNILQRNSAINRIMEEHLYQQRSGLINNDVMSRINQINQADLVVSGHITRLRDTNLIIISIFDVTEFQQIAGVYQVYNSLTEIRNLLPDLAQRLVEASRKEYRNLPGLAIPSFTVPAGVDQSDAMVLSHILAAEIANTGRYAVFPRTESVEDVLREHTFQRSGLTPGSVAMGTTRSIDYVLSPELLRLDSTTMFNAQILHTENGNLVEASNKEYEDLTDGINKNLMAELAMELTGRNIPGTTSQTVVAAIPENFICIEGGTFVMGSPGEESGRNANEIRRQVTISPFYMSIYPVTQKEYEEVTGLYPSHFSGDNLPVENVSWFDAIEYCNKLSLIEGLTPVYTINGQNVTWNRIANGYRLPTEAEWEYACRAGTTTAYNTGAYIGTEQANYYRSRTTPVGAFAANPWGIYDMYGNIWEWCWDWFGDYASGRQVDPIGTDSGTSRVIRGGSYNSSPHVIRSAYRSRDNPSTRNNSTGFRLVRN